MDRVHADDLVRDLEGMIDLRTGIEYADQAHIALGTF